MIMKNESRIIELLAEMVKGQDRLTGEVSGMKGEIIKIKDEIGQVRNELVKQNLELAQNSRSILQLAEEIRLVAVHELRISKLELAVFK